MNNNLVSCLLSLCCILLFFITSSSDNFIHFFVSNFNFHPLYFVLLLTILAFFLALLGMKDVRNGFHMMRSIVTIILTLTLSGMICFILFIGKLFN